MGVPSQIEERDDKKYYYQSSGVPPCRLYTLPVSGGEEGGVRPGLSHGWPGLLVPRHPESRRLTELAGVRPSVRPEQAVFLLVLAPPQFSRQPVRLLAQVGVSFHSPGRQPGVWRVLLHTI